MNATILNGGLAGDLFVDHVQDLLLAELATAGYQPAAWTLSEEKIAYCLGCFECWTKTPGLCRIDDAGRLVSASVINSHLVIYLSPVTFGGYSSELKKAVDRSICLLSPFFTHVDGEVHHQRRYDRYPALLGVGILPHRHVEQEQIFSTLISRNAINMHSPQHASVVVTRDLDEPALQAVLRPALSVQEAIHP